MSEQVSVVHERVDDIPAILAQLQKMRVAELIDEHFPTNGNRTGLSLGEMTVVWLSFILSEGDHRLYRVEPWIAQHQQTLGRCLGKAVEPRDGTDDRLATALDYLCLTENWAPFECALNQKMIRVYELQAGCVRTDSTTLPAFVTPEGMFQLGYSKDHRPDLPQVKISLSALDPLGLPLTTTVVAGNTADDPLYMPEIAKLRQSLQRRGLTYIGDCKMAALETRAERVAHSDYYLCPLSAKQLPETELARLLEPVFNGAQPLSCVRLGSAEADLSAETSAPVAAGFEYTIELTAQDQQHQTQRWRERRLVVRSLQLAERQEAGLRQRVARALTEVNALSERKKGKRLLPDEMAAREAAAAILTRHRVAGLVQVEVHLEIHEQPKRQYGSRPATTVRQERVRVWATSDCSALAQAVRRLGWRVYATNHETANLSLEQSVAAYRSEYLIEQGFRRLKGRPLSLAPLFLHDEHRIVGLICLLTIALRVLVLMQFVARCNLGQAGAALRGIYPGQPGRQTTRPTTEMMLRAFRGVTLSQVTLNEQTYDHLTPLSAVQKRILKLLGLPPETFSRLVPHLSNTDFHSRET